MQKAAGNQTRLQASYIETQRTSHNTVCENSATLATKKINSKRILYSNFRGYIRNSDKDKKAHK